ncbi:hypothetical protein P280DRAFT_521639 [Massarina eburnea CBS 473.64]|uniref:Uncharacterized protein n=1 Tax=Massarina eburnea CBS 473.64 TaxID=1395130 RepID=A0A6A6RRV1_9PLEO|nr:hypothetical protein P280DRAFT_521639 [Massarina eburnea CBS 473.64]
MAPIHDRIASVRAAFSSKQAFIEAIEIKADRDNGIEATERNPWKNDDLAISPSQDRTWCCYSYAAFWCTYDIARYAKTPSATTWSQIMALPVANTIGTTLGIYGTAAIYNVWGNINWNAWAMEHDVLTHDGARFYAMTVFPRFLNIHRGMWLGYMLGVAILSNAAGFLIFLGGYGIFLGPFLGIFITDYFFVRKDNVYIKNLYKPHLRYWYSNGFNWRPLVAWAILVAFVIPGFAIKFGSAPAGYDG